ncbi:MAG: 30S ribosomal protein S3, partial [Cyanobacteria bacterium J06629_18]
IDYAYVSAKTIYGILGIKVWVFKGEVIPGEEEEQTSNPRNEREPRRRQNRRRPSFEDRSNEN